MARRIRTTLDGTDVPTLLKDLIRQVYQHRLIRVLHDATITEASGYVGNFVTTVESRGTVHEIEHGAAILATGTSEHRPTEYLYGEDERVMTQLELEARVGAGDADLLAAPALAMIQCVGCRDEKRNYCSRICCTQAIKNALELKRLAPEKEITVFFRDMRTYGFSEDFYREAAGQGVRFVRFEADEKPVVEAAQGEGRPVLRVTAPDPILGQNLAIDVDHVVLSAAVVPSEGSDEAARIFKVARNPDGFFQEAHVKLRPVDFGADGLFLAGTAQYPKHVRETINSAYGAAGRTASLLSQDTVTASGAVCHVLQADCIACGACVTACTYGAVQMKATPDGKRAEVNPALCKGDGLCCSKCPTSAIVLDHFTDDAILRQIDAAFATSEDS
jgi:heterodisulfide reductase subunit A